MAILFLMLALGFVFCMEFEKSVKETIQKKEWNKLLIQFVLLCFSAGSGYLFAVSDYIQHSRIIWFVAISIFMIGVVQYIYTNWNIKLKKQLLDLASKKIGADVSEPTKTIIQENNTAENIAGNDINIKRE